MKIKLRAGVKKAVIKGEYINLDALLKYVNAVSTGGEAKMLILNGEIYVNGAVCTQRKKKIRNGDVVRYGKTVFCVFGGDNTPDG